MKRSLLHITSIVVLSISLVSCTDIVILMTGNSPRKVREGCKTPEPGTFLDPISNLMLIMGQKYVDIPDTLVEKSWKYVELLTPRVRSRIDTAIIAEDGYAIPVRIYNNRRNSARKQQNVIVFYHGGGFVWGSIRIYDNLCAEITRKTGAVVVSVGYRLAPEYPFPYAVNDSRRALEWVAANIRDFGGDSERITVMGDSAGGNLSAVMSLMSRDRGGPPILSQVLIYPATMFVDTLTPSRRYFLVENERDFVLGDHFMETALKSYLLHSEDPRDPYISPHFGKIDASLPKALIITAQCDPLRDEARQYGELLAENGVEATYLEYPGMMHGFVSFYQVFPEARRAIRDIKNFCGH